MVFGDAAPLITTFHVLADELSSWPLDSGVLDERDQLGCAGYPLIMSTRSFAFFDASSGLLVTLLPGRW
jgi:hypothetical protein